MPANTSPIFALTPGLAYQSITGATTDKTGATTANLRTLLTAGTNGTKVTQIGFKVEGTSLNGLLLIFITDTNGTNPKLYDEISIAAVSSTTTTATNRVFTAYNDLQLAAGQRILVGSTTLSANVIAWAQYGDF